VGGLDGESVVFGFKKGGGHLDELRVIIHMENADEISH